MLENGVSWSYIWEMLCFSMIKLIVFCYEDYRRNAGLSFHVLVPKAHSNEL